MIKADHQTFLKVFQNLSVEVKSTAPNDDQAAESNPLERFYRTKLALYTQPEMLRDLLEEKINRDLERDQLVPNEVKASTNQVLTNDPLLLLSPTTVILDSVYPGDHDSSWRQAKAVPADQPPQKRAKLTTSDDGDSTLLLADDDSSDESGDDWEIYWKSVWTGIKSIETMAREKALCQSLIGKSHQQAEQLARAQGYDLLENTMVRGIKYWDPTRIRFSLTEEGKIAQVPMPYVE